MALNATVFTLLNILWFCMGVAVSAQPRGEKKRGINDEEVTKLSIDLHDSTLLDKSTAIFKDLDNKGKELRNNIKSEVQNLKIDTIPSESQLRKMSDEHSRKIMEEQIPDLQYNSDNPESTPWKNDRLLENKFGRASVPNLPADEGLPSVVDKLEDYKEKVEDLNPSIMNEEKLMEELKKVTESMKDEKLKKTTRAFDSLYILKNKLESFNLQQDLLSARRIYSEKYIQKLYDSLGLKKADSIFQVAQAFSKTEISKEDLLNRLNTGSGETPEFKGIGYDKEKGILKVADSENLNALPDEYEKLKEKGLSDLQLSLEELAELPPLAALQVDTENMPVIDSLREIALKAKDFKVDERQITDELKLTAFKKKLSFLDKSYFEGILGVINDSTFSIVQISPSLGYHFKDNLSIGLGPVLSVQYQQRKISTVIGFRSFIKAEFWKQRGYVQVEDNVGPSLTVLENIKTIEHSLLMGGGGLLPVSGKLAINLGLFYRVNQDEVQPGGSPWVFRIGLSSVKNITND